MTKFVKAQINKPDIVMNPLRITKSAIQSIVTRFKFYGWSVEGDPTIKNRYKIVSPDGKVTLSMHDAKVFRHADQVDIICKRKELTKQMLDLSGLPVPVGGVFSSSEKEIAGFFFEKIAKPAVLKPTDSGGSRGVSVGVTSTSEFLNAWDYAVAAGGKQSQVIIEQFIRGIELRAFVVGDDVLSIVARVQPYVTGDGTSTVADLLTQLHELRKINYRTMKMPVKVDWKFVNEHGYTAESVPPAERIVFLNPLSLPTIGAFVVDVTNIVAPEIVALAKQAKNAIPQLEIAGIDILVENLEDVSTAYVVEVNTAAAVELHRYPTHGQARMVDHDIVDYFHNRYLQQNGSLNDG